jgi:hypothetical protein
MCATQALRLLQIHLGDVGEGHSVSLAGVFLGREAIQHVLPDQLRVALLRVTDAARARQPMVRDWFGASTTVDFAFRGVESANWNSPGAPGMRSGGHNRRSRWPVWVGCRCRN